MGHHVLSSLVRFRLAIVPGLGFHVGDLDEGGGIENWFLEGPLELVRHLSSFWAGTFI